MNAWALRCRVSLAPVGARRGEYLLLAHSDRSHLPRDRGHHLHAVGVREDPYSRTASPDAQRHYRSPHGELAEAIKAAAM